MTLISRSFELRGFSCDSKANGETDFTGPTEFFDTGGRLAYLKAYAKEAREFFGGSAWDQFAVSEEQVSKSLAGLKPQPQPTVRQHLDDTQWKWLSCREGLREERQAIAESWLSHPGVRIDDGHLVFESKVNVERGFACQDWRFFLEWEIRISDAASEISLQLQGISLKICGGQLSCRTEGDWQAVGVVPRGEWFRLRLEMDLDPDEKGFNLYLNNTCLCDFCPLPGALPVEKLQMTFGTGTALRQLWGVGYHKMEFTDDVHTRDYPFTMKTFLDENFRAIPSAEGWQTCGYDDSDWQEATLPHVHGGERNRGEDLLLRKTFRVDKDRHIAFCCETLDPGGEVWLNGRIIHVQHNRRPLTLDLTEWVDSSRENVIAVRVFAHKVKHLMRHTCTDRYTGWFMGRAVIRSTAKQFVDHVAIFTRSIGEPAEVDIRIIAKNLEWGPEESESKDAQMFKGSLQVELKPWFPDEAAEPSVVCREPVRLHYMRPRETRITLQVPNAKRWSVDRPFLYSVHVKLLDNQDRVIDDSITTTGMRTLGQDGGIFRLNGEACAMNGALIFGMRPPLETLAKYIKCAPADWILREILMIKAMGANTIRMSIHDSVEGGVNDPRFAEAGDQLGVLFQWTTGAWVRTASPWMLDIEGLPAYMEQVINHPSIAMWQPANHPDFKYWEDDGADWFTKVYEAIAAVDTSRLIMPAPCTSGLQGPVDDGSKSIRGKRLDRRVPAWTAAMVTRGNFDVPTGYGKTWDVLRKWPYPKDWDGEQGWDRNGQVATYLASTKRACFDFESEESAAQPNWNLCKGKPYYKIRSYEINYDQGSIGRNLDFDEWELSQAWQAFSAYEAYRKKRWLGYDGMAWCTLHGGGNSGTYEKPAIDFHGYAKMVFYALRMSFQKVLAGSRNVDMVYGPEDKIEPMVLHYGEAREVHLTVRIVDSTGRIVEARRFDNIHLPEGRCCVDLPPFKAGVPQEGLYRIEYIVSE